jgi:hypothetical protein
VILDPPTRLDAEVGADLDHPGHRLEFRGRDLDGEGKLFVCPAFDLEDDRLLVAVIPHHLAADFRREVESCSNASSPSVGTMRQKAPTVDEVASGLILGLVTSPLRFGLRSVRLDGLLEILDRKRLDGGLQLGHDRPEFPGLVPLDLRQLGEQGVVLSSAAIPPSAWAFSRHRSARGVGSSATCSAVRSGRPVPVAAFAFDDSRSWNAASRSRSHPRSDSFS